MAVSYHAIIRQMKKELDHLNESSCQQQILAKMHVIKSLADVVINSSDDTGEEKMALNNPKTNRYSISEAEAKMMGIGQSQSSKDVKQEHRLEEDDANGDSIFDF